MFSQKFRVSFVPKHGSLTADIFTNVSSRFCESTVRIFMLTPVPTCNFVNSACRCLCSYYFILQFPHRSIVILNTTTTVFCAVLIHFYRSDVEYVALRNVFGLRKQKAKRKKFSTNPFLFAISFSTVEHVRDNTAKFSHGILLQKCHNFCGNNVKYLYFTHIKKSDILWNTEISRKCHVAFAYTPVHSQREILKIVGISEKSSTLMNEYCKIYTKQWNWMQ